MDKLGARGVEMAVGVLVGEGTVTDTFVDQSLLAPRAFSARTEYQYVVPAVTPLWMTDVSVVSSANLCHPSPLLAHHHASY